MHSFQSENILIVITGPTAVGKTDVAIELAKNYNADIFSADSRQLYLEMAIGTAKPSISEMQGVKHHFIDHVTIKDKYDVGLFEKEAIKALSAYFKKNRVAILTGGTGLYIKAIVDGLDEFPDVDESITSALRKSFENDGIEFLQKELKKKDPVYYNKVDISNPHRLIRALSVIRQSSKPYSSFLKNKKANRDFKTFYVLLEREREELYERINQRVDIMMEKGLLKEVKSLFSFRHFKSLDTVGYQELFRYLDDQITLKKAVDMIKQNSRRYAKRQMTWFRKDPRWKRFHPDKLEDIVIYLEELIHE